MRRRIPVPPVAALLVAVALLAVGFGVLVRSTRFTPEPSVPSSSYRQAGIRLFELSRTLERRDALLRTLARQEWPAESLLVVADPALDATAEASVRRRLADAWQDVPRPGSGVRVVALLIRDTTQRVDSLLVRGSPFGRPFTVLLPELTDGRTCVTIVTVDFGPRWSGWLSPGNDLVRSGPQNRYWRTKAPLGACAFLARFGQPGRGIRQWLDSTRWAATRAPNWSTGPAGPPRNVSREGSGEPDLMSLAIDLLGGYGGQWNGVACSSGRPHGCEQYLSAAVEPRGPSIGGQYGRVVALVGAPELRQGIDFGRERWFYEPRPLFLSALVRDYGAERFASFWRSDRPLPDAFEAAFGLNAEAAWRAWIGKETGGAYAETGPRIPLRPLASAVGLALLGLALAFAAHARREMR